MTPTSIEPKPNHELTREDIARILARAGIPKDSKQWGDYVAAKRAVFGNGFKSSPGYEKQIRYITDYLGV